MCVQQLRDLSSVAATLNKPLQLTRLHQKEYMVFSLSRVAFRLDTGLIGVLGLGR